MTEERRDVVDATHVAEQLIDSVPESPRDSLFPDDPCATPSCTRSLYRVAFI